MNPVRAPTVSVVVPTYNRVEFLRDTIDSVRAQTWEDWELVVGDDGSAKPTREWLKQLSTQARIRVVWGSHTGRPAVARNLALREARGEYVAFLDSDDLWGPEKLAKQLADLARNPSCGWSYCGFVRVDGANQVLAAEATRRWVCRTGRIFGDIITAEVSLRTPCMLVRREVLERTGGFDERLADGEDLDLWLRLALIADATAVDEPLVRVRVAPGSYTSRPRFVRADWLTIVEKMQRLAGSQWQPLLRRERARHAMRLAREYVQAGEPRRACAIWRDHLPHAWRYAGSWREILRTLAGVRG
jgi:glycosyltransferase involved in cell wall biosynthesis